MKKRKIPNVILRSCLIVVLIALYINIEAVLETQNWYWFDINFSGKDKVISGYGALLAAIISTFSIILLVYTIYLQIKESRYQLKQFRKEYKLQKKQLKEENKREERYAFRVSMEEIEKNDFNLNISGYLSTALTEKKIDLKAVNEKLVDIEKKVTKSMNEHNKYLKELGLKNNLTNF